MMRNFENARNKNDSSKKSSVSSFVCLFWLSDDYTKIIDERGHVEISPEDVSAKKHILPIGMHDSYNTGITGGNRGTVSLEGGKIEFSVGKNCPDTTINMLRHYMGLEDIPMNESYRTAYYDK
jgi:hypothetical protein